MEMVNTGLRLPSILALLVLWAAPAAADDPPEAVPMDFLCDGLHRTQVVVDGMQRDWEDEARATERVGQLVEGAYRYDWTGPVDASFRLWCRYTENGLYFAVVGRDNVVAAPEGDDGDVFEIWFRVDVDDRSELLGVRVPLWDLESGVATPVWAEGSGREGELRAARGEVAPRDNGYFLEFNIPYIADPALAEPFAPIPFVAAHRDIDHDTRGERVAVVASAPYDRADPNTFGQMTFTGPDAQIRRLARERGVEAGSLGGIFADVGGTSARDHAFLLDGHLFVGGTGLGDYAWTSILVAPNERYTPLAIEAHDIDADGDAELFVTTRKERRSIDLGGNVFQEFLTVYDLQERELVPLLVQEIANELDDGARFELSMELRDRRDRSVVRFRVAEGGTLDADRWRLIDDPDGGYNRILAPAATGSVINWDRRGDGTWVVLDESP